MRFLRTVCFLLKCTTTIVVQKHENEWDNRFRTEVEIMFSCACAKNNGQNSYKYFLAVEIFASYGSNGNRWKQWSHQNFSRKLVSCRFGACSVKLRPNINCGVVKLPKFQYFYNKSTSLRTTDTTFRTESRTNAVSVHARPMIVKTFHYYKWSNVV